MNLNIRVYFIHIIARIRTFQSFRAASDMNVSKLENAVGVAKKVNVRSNVS